MGRSSKSRLLACSAAVVVAGLVYLNSLHNPFFYDDVPSVVNNKSLVDPTFRSVLMQNVSRPVVNISYLIDHAIWGRDPFGYHLTNVLVHMLNVALLFLLAQGVGLDRWRSRELRGLSREKEERWATRAAAVAAMLFAVHPMMTEAVGYISGRSDLLSGAFMLLSMVTLRRWLNTDRTRWLVATLATFLLAIASKETAVVLPALFLYYILFVRGDAVADRRRHVLMLCVPLLSLAVVGAAVRIGLFVFVEHAGVAQWQWRFALTEFDVFVRYLAMMIAPIGQSIFHGVPVTRSLFDPRAIVALCIVGMYLTLIVASARRRGVIGFGLVWFLLMLVPSALLILLNHGEAMVERRVYFASAGLFLAVGQGAASLATLGRPVSRLTRVAVVSTAVVMVAGLAGRTVIRNLLWSNPVWLWAEAVDRNPGFWYPQLLLGYALHDAGRHDEAIQILQQALRFGPTTAELYQALGRCQIEEKRLDESVVTFTALWTIYPKSAAATNGRATVALIRGQVEDARRGFIDSLAADPQNIQARRGLVTIEQRAGELEEARRRCEELAALEPGARAAICVEDALK